MPRVILKEKKFLVTRDGRRPLSAEDIKLPKPVNIPRPPAPKAAEASK